MFSMDALDQGWARDQAFGNRRDGLPSERPPALRLYSTSTTARSQGWIQHANRCTPGESPVICTVLPGATTTVPAAAQAAAGTNGVVPVGPPTPLRGGTNPPPNAVTSVNV